MLVRQSEQNCTRRTGPDAPDLDVDVQISGLGAHVEVMHDVQVITWKRVRITQI